MIISTFKRKFGIVGLDNAGKTVFLMSLLSHLKNHDYERFHLKKDASWIGKQFQKKSSEVQIRRFKRIPIADANEFNYEKHRDMMLHQGKWPKKTCDTSHYHCSFERSDWLWRDVDLSFFDFPGERIADACMGGDYAAWSDYMIKCFDDDSRYRELTQNFLSLQSLSNLQESTVVQEYKLALARLAHQYKPLISPSLFLFDQQGTSVSKKYTAEQIAQERICGLSRDTEFAPMTGAASSANAELAMIFAKRYEEYKKTIVLPLFESLKNCHRLIVLIDIIGILAAGTGMYEDTRKIIKSLLDICEPAGKNLMRKIKMISATSFLPESLRPGGISKIAFVAPKADLIHPQDSDRLSNLLNAFLKRIAVDYDVQFDCFICSAIKSTKALDEDHKMSGKILFNSNGEQRSIQEPEVKFPVSPLPEKWEEDWSVGKYIFPDVYPVIPRREDIAPEQQGMDKIMDFLFEENWSE